MHLLALQWNALWQDSQANLTLLADRLPPLITQYQPDLVVLPELFHSGFSMQPSLFAENLEGKISQALRQLAQRHQITLIAGVAQRSQKRDCFGTQPLFFNTALSFNAQGQLIGRYIKQKSFSYAGEDQIYQAGHQSNIIEVEGMKFGMLICYDLRFPELFRTIAKQVDGFIVLANWPAARQNHWQALLQARAIENQCFVLGVNRIGQDQNGLDYLGGSVLFNPWGEKLTEAKEEDLTLIAELDIHLTQTVRQQFPALNDLTL